MHPHLAEGERLELLPRAGAAQHGAHAGQQLAQREGLGDVVVGAELEAAHAVDLLAPRGEHDHRHVHAATAELAAHVPARSSGIIDVEQHEIGRLAQRAGQPLLAARRRQRLVALEPEVVLQSAHDRRLVVHDQDARHSHSAARGSHSVKRLPSSRRALHAHAAAVGLGDVPDERQADSTAPASLRLAPPDPVELVEDPRRASAGAMPTPRSATLSAIPSPSRCTSTAICGRRRST